MNNIPKLRFPEFNGEWEKKKLGEVAEFSKGKGISKADIVENGNTECIRYGELYTHYGETINKVKSKTNIDVKNLVLSEANDVIIPASGETQIDIATASCVLKNGIALGGDLNIIKTKNEGVFLSYYLNSKKKYEIANLAQGISVVHLYSSQLSQLVLNLPFKTEQTKIATFLTAVDEKLQALKKKKAFLEHYKKGVMQKIFSQELRFKPALSEVEGDENGKDFPDWEVKKLGEVCEINMGQSPSSKSYNSIGNGIPLIQGNADIQNRVTSPRNWTTEKTKECIIGDLILTVRAPVGAVAKSMHNACIGRGVCSIRSNPNSNIEFIYQFLLDYETKWSSLEQGSTFTAVSGIEIKKLEIHFPSLPEQTRIANFLSALDEKINQTQTQIEKTVVWKKGLLQKMFV
jgi:type I restriction enzyme S subunit